MDDWIIRMKKEEYLFDFNELSSLNLNDKVFYEIRFMLDRNQFHGKQYAELSGEEADVNRRLAIMYYDHIIGAIIVLESLGVDTRVVFSESNLMIDDVIIDGKSVRGAEINEVG